MIKQRVRLPQRPTAAETVGGRYLVIAAALLATAGSGPAVFSGGDPVSKWLGLALLVAAGAEVITLVVSLVSRHRQRQTSGPGRAFAGGAG